MKRKLEEAKASFSKRAKCHEKHDIKDQAPANVGASTSPSRVAQQSVSSSFTSPDVNAATGENKFHGMSVTDLLFLEVYAGTATLSKVARDAGFQMLPTDKTSARASQIFVAQYDVTNPCEVEALLDLISTERHRLVAVHLAPACGTASRAREKNLSSYARQGFKVPQPLRSKEEPMGLDGLEGLDKIRTESANLVYSATAKIMRQWLKQDTLCSLENPANSLFWDFPEAVVGAVFLVFCLLFFEQL